MSAIWLESYSDQNKRNEQFGESPMSWILLVLAILFILLIIVIGILVATHKI